MSRVQTTINPTDFELSFPRLRPPKDTCQPINSTENPLSQQGTGLAAPSFADADSAAEPGVAVAREHSLSGAW
jgi:hypothetical protein